MNEAETRAEHIDTALKAAGWGVVEGSKILREYHITKGRIEDPGRRGKPLMNPCKSSFFAGNSISARVYFPAKRCLW